MTAKEWLEVIKLAKDYNPDMTPLIEKYGEMLLDEYKAANPVCDCGEDDEDEVNSWNKQQFQSPLIPSPELADIIGAREILRTDAVKKLFQYIKENNLQDQKEKRYINLDEKMKKVFINNKDRISIFEISKYLGNHLTKI